MRHILQKLQVTIAPYASRLTILSNEIFKTFATLTTFANEGTNRGSLRSMLATVARLPFRRSLMGLRLGRGKRVSIKIDWPLLNGFYCLCNVS